jgi:hypothetical protein
METSKHCKALDGWFGYEYMKHHTFEHRSCGFEPRKHESVVMKLCCKYVPFAFSSEEIDRAALRPNTYRDLAIFEQVNARKAGAGYRTPSTFFLDKSVGQEQGRTDLCFYSQRAVPDRRTIDLAFAVGTADLLIALNLVCLPLQRRGRGRAEHAAT